MKIRVSVIVPVYNVENYLKKCLNSLVNQTLEDIEIIVVNDGSTDKSPQIIEEFAKLYGDVILAYNKKNGGLSDARNFGIQKATGEYLAFVDSDDWVDIDMLEKMYKSAKKYNAEIVLCNLLKEDENGKILQKLDQIAHYKEGGINLFKNNSSFGELSSFACNKLFKKTLFDGIEFPVGMHFEDIATIPILISKARKMVKMNDYFYHYLERQGSISKTHTAKGLDMFKAIKRVEKYIEEKHPKPKVLTKELRRFFIIQGYYSYLAYLGFVKNDRLLKQMLKELNYELKVRGISKKEIRSYQRNGVNYLNSLPKKKKAYYTIALTSSKLLRLAIKLN